MFALTGHEEEKAHKINPTWWFQLCWSIIKELIKSLFFTHESDENSSGSGSWSQKYCEHHYEISGNMIARDKSGKIKEAAVTCPHFCSSKGNK